MPHRDAFSWFQKTFHRDLECAVAHTPFSLAMVTVIAAQETGHRWGRLRDKHRLAQLRAIGVGDTHEADPGRSAVPKPQADLVAAPRGEEIGQSAPAALVQMVKHVPACAGVAKQRTRAATDTASFKTTSSPRMSPYVSIEQRPSPRP
jgi:hypothetical protein